MSEVMLPLDLTVPIRKGTVTLVEASAGTGKTYNLARVYIKLLLEEKLSVKSILTVTFTKAATAELAVRIRELIRHMLLLFSGSVEQNDVFDTHMLYLFKGREAEVIESLHLALSEIDEAAIYTIHSFCQRTLQQATFESGALFGLEPLADESELLLDTARDFWRSHLYKEPSLVVASVRALGVTPQELVELLHLYRMSPDTYVDSCVVSYETASQKLIDLAQHIQHTFAEVEVEVRTLIEENKALTKNVKTYNAAALDAYFEDIRTFIRTGAFKNIKSFEIFTPAALKDNRTSRAKEKNLPPPEHIFFMHCARFVEAIRISVGAFCHLFLTTAEERIDEKMIAGRHMSYHDMLTQLHKALISKTSGKKFVNILQDKYKAALVDEFQDTDSVQYGIFSTIFSDQIIYYIGDPKQAIYRFRGADINTYLQASHGADNRCTLTTNWRSSPNLVRAVNHIFSRIPHAMGEEGIDYNGVDAGLDSKVSLATPVAIDGNEAPLQFMFLPWEEGKRRPSNAIDRDLLPFIAEEIKRLCRGGHHIKNKAITLGDIAILSRTGKQGMAIQRELRKHRIHSVLITDITVFNTHEMMELVQLLSAVARPQDKKLVSGVLLGGLWGMSPLALHELQGDMVRWGEIMALFEDWHRMWIRYGVMEVLIHFMHYADVAARMLHCIDGERRYANLLQAIEVLNNASSEGKRGIEDMLMWMHASIQSSDKEKEHLQLRLESDADAVKIVTIHKSKGLEFPVVFCPDLWRTFVTKEVPFVYHKDAEVHLVLRESIHLNKTKLLAEQERLAEDLRLVYVALTRAKYRCYIADGSLSKNYPVSALMWLLHRSPEDTVETWMKDLKKDLLGSDDLYNDLRTFVAECSDIGIRVVKNTAITPSLPSVQGAGERSPVVCSVMQDVSLQSWRTSSFSSLTLDTHAGSTQTKKAREQGDDIGVPHVQDTTPAQGIFAFPKGPAPGNALHRIFERIAFNPLQVDLLAGIVEDALSFYNIHKNNKHVVIDMVKTVISSNMPCLKGLGLRDLSDKKRFTELEFVFPLKHLKPEALNAVLQEIYTDTERVAEASWSRLDFNPLRGYIRGFIDLVACFEGKYYIIDWKSNHLGNNPEDYGQVPMEAAMQKHHYTLQYLLYTVALAQYLAGRIKNYSYEEHFGGVYYVFLRGVVKDGDTGWYFNRPKAHTIESLKTLLLDV